MFEVQCQFDFHSINTMVSLSHAHWPFTEKGSVILGQIKKSYYNKHFIELDCSVLFSLNV